MGIERLLRTTIVAPAGRADDVLTSLVRFGEFHPLANEDLQMVWRLKPLYERARKLYLELESAIRALDIEGGSGVIEVILKGEPDPEEIGVKGLEELLDVLHHRAEPILDELRRLEKRGEELRSEIEGLEKVRSRLQVRIQAGLNLSTLTRLRYIYAAAFIAFRKDLEEILASLVEAAVFYQQFSREQVLLLVLASPSRRENIVRALRVFSLTPLEAEEGEGVEVLKERLREVEEDLEELKREARGLAEKREMLRLEKGRELESLRSLARDLVAVIQRARGLAGRIIVIEGYVPEGRVGELAREVNGLAYIHMEKPRHRSLGESHPTKLRNNWITEAFRQVTLIHGVPSPHEVDPTPFVSVFLSIFYGIMFADLGQGLVLAMLGLLITIRARGGLRLWGRLLVFLGASATIGGLLIQEAFGFKLTPVTGVKPILELIEHHGGTATISGEAVARLFTFAPLLGFTHVSLALILSTITLFRHGEVGEAIFSKVASLIMYVSGLLFALGFITTRGFEGLLESPEPVPILGLPAALVGGAGLAGVLTAITLLVAGRGIAAMLGLLPGGSVIGQIGTGLLEVLENIIHFMSNTLSYIRVSILMIIHVALMLLINSSWEALGPSSLGILIIGNVGVMGLEGLLVFIQALRLHLYEFFSKFFMGGGELFQPLTIASQRHRIVFRK